MHGYEQQKIGELRLEGTCLHHWFPRTYRLNKYYVVYNYPYITFLTHQQPLSTVLPKSRSAFTMKPMKLKIQGPSLTRAPSKVLEGALATPQKCPENLQPLFETNLIEVFPYRQTEKFT
jgi:hypothetical protein